MFRCIIWNFASIIWSSDSSPELHVHHVKFQLHHLKFQIYHLKSRFIIWNFSLITWGSEYASEIWNLKSEILLPLEALNFTLERQPVGCISTSMYSCITESVFHADNAHCDYTASPTLDDRSPRYILGRFYHSQNQICMYEHSHQYSRHSLIVQYLVQHTSIRSVVLPAGCMLCSSSWGVLAVVVIVAFLLCVVLVTIEISGGEQLSTGNWHMLAQFCLPLNQICCCNDLSAPRYCQGCQIATGFQKWRASFLIKLHWYRDKPYFLFTAEVKTQQKLAHSPWSLLGYCWGYRKPLSDTSELGVLPALPAFPISNAHLLCALDTVREHEVWPNKGWHLREIPLYSCLHTHYVKIEHTSVYFQVRSKQGTIHPYNRILLRLKYFSDIPRTSGRTPDVRLCAMAVAFFHYQTTCAQFGRVFQCFSFHNISPFLLPDLFS